MKTLVCFMLPSFAFADVTDALHVEAKYRVDDERREIFFFREGSVVFWNMPEEEVRITCLKSNANTYYAEF